MEPVFFTNAMTCEDELRGTNTSQKLCLGPLVSGSFPEHSPVTPFMRPGPEVVSDAIPVFFIGRNRDGLWIARDAQGKSGGMFWREEAALRFARKCAGPGGCATVFPQTRLELDIENRGNPLIACLATARRLLTHQALRFIFAVRKIARS